MEWRRLVAWPGGLLLTVIVGLVAIAVSIDGSGDSDASRGRTASGVVGEAPRGAGGRAQPRGPICRFLPFWRPPMAAVQYSVRPLARPEGLS